MSRLGHTELATYIAERAEAMRIALRMKMAQFGFSGRVYDYALALPDAEFVLRVLLPRLTGHRQEDEFDVDALDGDRWVLVTQHRAGDDRTDWLASVFDRDTVLLRENIRSRPELIASSLWPAVREVKNKHLTLLRDTLHAARPAPSLHMSREW